MLMCIKCLLLWFYILLYACIYTCDWMYLFRVWYILCFVAMEQRNMIWPWLEMVAGTYCYCIIPYIHSNAYVLYSIHIHSFHCSLACLVVSYSNATYIMYICMCSASELFYSLFYLGLYCEIRYVKSPSHPIPWWYTIL